MYPKLGPGQLWELVAKRVIELGGEIVTEFNVDRVHVVDGRLQAVSGTGS